MPNVRRHQLAPVFLIAFLLCASATPSHSPHRAHLPLPGLVAIPSDVVTAEAVALVGWFSSLSWPDNGIPGDDRIPSDAISADASRYQPLSPMAAKNVQNIVKTHGISGDDRILGDAMWVDTSRYQSVPLTAAKNGQNIGKTHGISGDDRIPGDAMWVDTSRYQSVPLMAAKNGQNIVKTLQPSPRDKTESSSLSFGPLKNLRRIHPEQIKRSSHWRDRFKKKFSVGRQDSMSFVDDLREVSFLKAEKNDTDIGFPKDALARPKRKICCNTEGVCRTCLDGMDAEEVVDHYFDFFADVPRSLAEFSILGAEQNEHCDRLDIPLFSVDIKQMLVTPNWIRDISYLGWCPSVLVTKDLGPNSFPAKLVEVKCLCERKKCSDKGTDFRCVPVYKTVATWHRFGKTGSAGKPYSPEMTRVRIGCVCAQRPAQWGGEINSIFALN